MTKDTPTPRTDALVEANRGKPCSQSVDCEFARELERELIDAMAGEARAKYAGRELEHDLAAAMAALRELVACKDLYTTICDARWQDHSTNWYEEACADHVKRVQPAWSAARALVGQEG